MIAAIKCDGNDDALHESKEDIVEVLIMSKGIFYLAVPAYGMQPYPTGDPNSHPIQLKVFTFIPSVLDGGQSWFRFHADLSDYMPESLRDYMSQVVFVSIEASIENKTEDGDNLMLLAGSLVPQ